MRPARAHDALTRTTAQLQRPAPLAMPPANKKQKGAAAPAAAEQSPVDTYFARLDAAITAHNCKGSMIVVGIPRGEDEDEDEEEEEEDDKRVRTLAIFFAQARFPPHGMRCCASAHNDSARGCCGRHMSRAQRRTRLLGLAVLLRAARRRAHPAPRARRAKEMVCALAVATLRYTRTSRRCTPAACVRRFVFHAVLRAQVYTAAEVALLRHMLINDSRDDAINKAQKFACGGQDPDDGFLMFNTESGASLSAPSRYDCRCRS